MQRKIKVTMANGTESMNITFEGNSHQVDANTLINALIHYQTIINEANRIYGGGTREIKMQVNALKQGSFIIDICLIDTIKNLFSASSVAYISGLVVIIDGVIRAYQHFKGKRVKDGDITINGDLIINQQITKVYNNRVVREAISKSIENAQADGNVDGFSVTAANNKTTFERKDFTDYIYNDFDSEDVLPDERVVEEDALLTITSLSFEPKSKWKFIYNGFYISAFIKDELLMEVIDKGERFGKGDALKVKLRITQKYEKTCHAYYNSSYSVIEFHEHIQAPQQSKIEFKTDDSTPC